MKRLIDTGAYRDEFMQAVYDVLENEPDNIKANLIIDAFDSIPITYDIDNVVKQLEDELNLAKIEKRRCINENVSQFDEVKGYARGISYAIVIMKNGEIKNKMS